MNDTRIVFDHVPKTGGSALIRAFSDVVGDKPQRVASGSHRSVLAESAGFALTAGHLWYAPGERLSPDCYYATVLREPVDRFLSHYYFASNDFNAADDYPAAMARRLPIDEYVARSDPSLIAFYSNVQARHFAPLAIGPHQDPARLPEADLLAAAKAALREFSLVGIYPHLREFVQRVCRDRGLAAPGTIPKVNVTSRRLGIDQLPAPVRGRLEAANQVDRELYWWATEEFLRNDPRPRAARGSSAGVVPTAAGFGSKEIEIARVTCQEESPGTVWIEIECAVHAPVGPFTLGIAVLDPAGRTVFGANTHKSGIELVANLKGARHFGFLLRGGFAPGAHSVTIALHRGSAHTDGCFHWQDEAGGFEIRAQGQEAASSGPIHGSFYEQSPPAAGNWTAAAALAG